MSVNFRFPRRGGLPRRSRRLLPILITIAALVVAGAVFTNVWTDVLWYDSVGYSSIYVTKLFTQIGLFVVAGVVMALLVGVNIALAYRTRPAYRPLSAEQQGLERYRASLQPYHRMLVLGISVVVGLVTGSSVTGDWQIWLQFANRAEFGVDDFQFGIDISFFTFVYPFLRLVLNLLFAIVVVAFVAAAFTHYLYGGVRLQTPGDRISVAARVHLSVLLGVFVLLLAVGYWLDRYGLAYSERGVRMGPSYTDVNAVLPAKTILVVIAVICAVLFFANIIFRNLMLPGVAFGLLVLSAVLIGGVWPAVVQQFQVKPNERAKEAPYIERNIKATRAAYGIDDVKVKSYNARTDLSRDEVGQNGESSPSGVRLLDPSVMSATFQQLQQIRGFYSFNDVLDVDRYTVNGEEKVLLVAAREMKGPPQGQDNWVNTHLVYTHGYGLVASPTNAVNREGQPKFVVKNMPVQSQLGKFQPRIYFGEQLPTYAIAGAPKGATPKEFDYPNSAQSGQRSNTYQGSGGVPIGSVFHRMLYALQFQDRNILLSGAINEESRLLYVRDPKERVRKIAPFLNMDGNVYPVVVNGRMKWVVDGYTTTGRYPYSQRTSLAQATRDANTNTSQSVSAQPEDRINYIRNSVKAVVDAYSGEVTLYKWNPNDPLLATWANAFPDLFEPKSAIPKQLMNHLRYPVDLFKVQRNIFGKYHVQDPQAFYGGQDFWRVPNDPTRKKAGKQPPYYLQLTVPGKQRPVFSLTSTFVPRDRANLAAFMSVNSEPGKNYGQLRVLQLPRSRTVPGPAQVQNQFDSNPTVAQQLNLLRRGDSKVVRGNLLTLPVSGGLIYVEPVYVQSSGREAYPVLRRVLVSYGQKVGFAPSLNEALNQVFGTQQPDQGDQDDQGGDQPSGGNEELQQALERAQQAYRDGQEALSNGDFEAYGQAREELRQALEEAARLQQEQSQQ